MQHMHAYMWLLPILLLVAGRAAASRDISLQGQQVDCVSAATLQATKQPVADKYGWDALVFGGEWGPSNVASLGGNPEAQARAQLNGIADQVNKMSPDRRRRWADALAPAKSEIQVEMERFARGAAISLAPAPVTVEPSKLTLGTMVLACGSGAADGKRFVPYIALPGSGGGRQQQQPPQQARATLGDAPLDRGAAAAGRAPANGFPSGAFRGKLTVITPLGQSVGSEPGPVDASLEFSQGDDGGLVADGEIAADVLGTRCTFDMKVACQPAAESFCGSGKDAWYCPVTSIERWDDPCIGNIRATPKAKSVSFCYGNGEVEVKEVKQMLAIVQGALPQEQ